MDWMEWYQGLIKPSWTPSPATIGRIWNVLYPIILATDGYVFYQVLSGRIERIVSVPFAINLVANLLFFPTMFYLRNLPLAAMDILIVWGSIVWSMVLIWPSAPWVALAQVPYLAWVSIATTLQLAITRCNLW